MLVAYLLILVLLLICSHIFIRYREYARIMNRIPGPPASPFFGNLLLLVNISAHGTWLLERELFRKYYPIFKMWKLTAANIMTCHSDHIKTLLSCKKNITKGEIYKFMKYDPRGGIITSDGPLWHQRRRILNQAFTPDLLNYYSKTVIKHAEKFITELRCQPNDFILNTPPEFLKLAMAVALEGTMGLEAIGPDEEDMYRNAFSELNKIIGYRALRPYLKGWLFNCLPVGRRLAKTVHLIYSLTTKIIEEREAYHKNFKPDILENDNVKRDSKFEGKKQCLFVTDVLLEAEKEGLIDRTGMCEETMTLLLAGFETTGTQMCFILALLSENKKAQDLIRAEILEVLNGEDDKITITNIKKMEYLDRCIKESMRLYPAVENIVRSITDTIKLGEYKVLSGTDVFMNIYELHRDPNFWPEPTTFDPDRFLPENIKRRHKFSYAPFSAGLRNCIGQKLAMAQMKILTAYIIHNFILEPVDLLADVKLEMKITLAVEKYRVKFIRIDR